MTNLDTINFLNQVRKMLLDDKSWLESTIQPINEAFDMATFALEKQIPMKALPYEMGIDGKIEIPCGNCGSGLDGIWDYCPFCGQKILWRAKDDA